MQSHHIVIGTAGHIDHGKTRLVHALTGRNTDRLQEEQQRGISIDIDFAPLQFADGTVVGIVDVPGHERFIRNMVAGAAGIDAALIVVDVNEGMMPQTYEHLSILQLLGVEAAVIALTKIDAADSDLVEVAEEVVRDELSSTPFMKAPIVRVSAVTGQGLDSLREALYRLAVECAAKDAGGAFRLPVDKVFSVPGFGTVVSGTTWRGTVKAGDVVEVLPGRREARVRGVQVHGQNVFAAEAGQRTALNLVGVDRNEIRRGFVVAARGTLAVTELLDARLSVLPQASQGLSHRQRVHLHLGTAEAIAIVLLLEADTLSPGEEAYAQLRLDRPLVVEPLDNFIVRTYSPVLTVGGGHVIDAVPARLHRRKRTDIVKMLTDRDSNSPLQRLLGMLRGNAAVSGAELAHNLGLTEAETQELLSAAENRREVTRLPSGWVGAAALEQTLMEVEQRLWELHRRQRFLQWMPRTALLQILQSQFKQRDALWLIEEGVQRNLWTTSNTLISATDWLVVLSPEETNLLTRVLGRLKEYGLQLVSTSELVQHFPQRDRVAQSLLLHAKEQGQAIEVAEGQWLHASVLNEAKRHLAQLYREQGMFTVAMARDVWNSNRKVSVALLEYLDSCKFTLRRGDNRSIVDQV